MNTSLYENRILVTVIIPVYNVENYLPQCLNSVIGQTFFNLEILIIDDGSTDRSGNICDEFALIDDRIIVFHTHNKGLSMARNYALDNCSGNYIFFLDSDDWLEEKAIELLVNSMLLNNSDIAVCGYYCEWGNQKTIENELELNGILNGINILKKYLHGYGIGNVVWNKLFRRELFDHIRFPNGRVYEDISTTYKLLDVAGTMSCVQKPLIHYRIRSTSIAKSHSFRNLLDYWVSYNERYEALINRCYDCRVELLGKCVDSIGRFWRWHHGNTYEEKKSARENIDEMQTFAREHEREIFGDKRYSLLTRFYCFVARFSNPAVFCLLYYMNQVYRFFKKETMYK